MKTIFIKLLAIIASALLTASAPALAQDAQPLAEADRQAVTSLARSVSALPNRTDEVLAALDFRPDWIESDEFQRWPALRKLETAYLSAVEADRVEGGRKFIAAAASVIEQEYTGAVRYDPALRSFLDAGPVSTSVPFAQIRSDNRAAVSSEVKEALLGIGKYVDAVPGGMQEVMSGCCGLSVNEVYDVLRSAPNREAALLEAIATGRMPPEDKARLMEMVRIFSENTRAVAYEDNLQPFFEPSNASGRGGIAIPSQPQSGQPSRQSPGTQFEARRASNNTNYDNLISRIARGAGIIPKGSGSKIGGGSGASIIIDRARLLRGGRRAGFGGVVFGAPVLSEDDLVPTKLWWNNEPGDSEWGRFEVQLQDGRIVSTRRFLAEDSFASIQIISRFDPETIVRFQDPEGSVGIGLASVTVGNPSGAYILLHPDLFGRQIGNYVAQIDAFRGVLSSETYARVRARSDNDQVVSHGWYKISDVPMEIIESEGLIRPQRIDREACTPSAESQVSAEGDNDDHTALPNKLARTAFITFCSLEGRTPQPEKFTRFYSMVPDLMRESIVFERVNGFAETFAIIRWAASHGATIEAPVEPIAIMPKLCTGEAGVLEACEID